MQKVTRLAWCRIPLNFIWLVFQFVFLFLCIKWNIFFSILMRFLMTQEKYRASKIFLAWPNELDFLHSLIFFIYNRYISGRSHTSLALTELENASFLSQAWHATTAINQAKPFLSAPAFPCISNFSKTNLAHFSLICSFSCCHVCAWMAKGTNQNLIKSRQKMLSYMQYQIIRICFLIIILKSEIFMGDVFKKP